MIANHYNPSPPPPPPPPKAMNIVRPTSPLFQFPRSVIPGTPMQETLSQTSSNSSTASSTPSSLSAFSTASSLALAGPLLLKPGFTIFQHNKPSWGTSMVTAASGTSSYPSPSLPTSPASMVMNSHAFFRQRRDSGTSESVSQSDDEIDSVDDGDRESLSSEEDGEPKIVARIKQGTILNGRGEFINKGSSDELANGDARFHRKIADLEIEKSSLLTINQSLEDTVRRQSAQIADLQRQLQTYESLPPTPVSDKASFPDLFPSSSILDESCSNDQSDAENDQVFQRIRAMLKHLIEQAEAAIKLKRKPSGRVLVEYHGSIDEGDVRSVRYRPHETNTYRRSWSPGQPAPAPSPQPRQGRPLLRRVSDGQDRRPLMDIVSSRSPRSPTDTHTRRTAMQRSLSRQSSPPNLGSTIDPSPTPTSMPRLRPRSSSQRVSPGRATPTPTPDTRPDVVDLPPWYN